MAINPNSVVGFLLKEAGYVETDIAKIVGIVNNQAPAVTAVISSITTAVQAAEAAFAAGEAVATPAFDATIDGHKYSVTVNFQPA